MFAPVKVVLAHLQQWELPLSLRQLVYYFLNFLRAEFPAKWSFARFVTLAVVGFVLSLAEL